MPLRAVLFDLDGTLVDTLAICYLAFRHSVDQVGGPPLTDADIHALFGPSEDGMMQRVLPSGWQPALDIYFGEYARLLPTCPAIIPDLASALALLRDRRILTALVTGKSATTAMMSLCHFGIDKMFDAVETGSPNGVVKADAIRRLLDHWTIAPRAAAYVGDAAADMRAAHDAGVIAAGAAWAYGARADELQAARADMIFTETQSFVAWLESATCGA
jgi:phosphoglycolate phosphatase-like HAD superfamily hydrolase